MKFSCSPPLLSQNGELKCTFHSCKWMCKLSDRRSTRKEEASQRAPKCPYFFLLLQQTHQKEERLYGNKSPQLLEKVSTILVCCPTTVYLFYLKLNQNTIWKSFDSTFKILEMISHILIFDSVIGQIVQCYKEDTIFLLTSAFLQANRNTIHQSQYPHAGLSISLLFVALPYPETFASCHNFYWNFSLPSTST